MEQFYKYPNAKVQAEPEDGLVISGRVVRLEKVGLYRMDMLIESEDGEYEDVDYTDCKLILKSLEGITEEDLKHACKLLNVSERFMEIQLRSELLDWINNKWSSGSINNKWEALAVFDFLRSRNYDIDGYIEKGLAIKEK